VKRALFVLAVMLAGCQGDPTDPLEEFRDAHGRLSGLVTIQPEPASVDAYRQRKVLVYDAPGSRLLHTVDLDTRGFYLIDLGPGTYVVDIRGVGLDSSPDVPKTVTIKANVVTRVDIAIDTGVR
jgi:hypothetical protein